MNDEIGIDAELREELGFPPDPADMEFTFEPLDEELTLSDMESGEEYDFPFTHSLWVRDIAEAYLGTNAYTDLVAAFAAVPGIRAVVQIDREVYNMALTEDADEEGLEDALWAAFMKVAEQAF